MPGSSQSAPHPTGATPLSPRPSAADPLSDPIHPFPRTDEPFRSRQAPESPAPSDVWDEADANAAAHGIPGEDFPDFVDPDAQPRGQNGVTSDMATLALNPQGAQAGRLTGADFSGFTPPQQSVSSELHTDGNFGSLDDAAIMLELKAGNMAAFDVLMQKYRKPIVNFMYRMTHNQAVAEELAQEVFLRVYRSRETYRAEARFSTWLYRIATNLGVNHARDNRHERTAAKVYLDEPDAESGTTPDVADQAPGAEAGLLRDERMAAIREHVMALPERQRMAVLMHKYEGMDYKQIGDVLKLSESATKSLLFRAYQTLRGKLKDFV